MSGFARFGLLAALMFAAAQVFALDVRVMAFAENRALLRIENKQHWLRPGEASPEGVQVLSASTRQVKVRFPDGRVETLLPGADLHENFSAPQKRSVSIARHPSGMYFTSGSINGQVLGFMIDTGASDVAISQRTAERLGLNYRAGERGRVATAQGVANVWVIKLRSVKLGDIERFNVEAAVVEGNAPEPALLGMSFLSTLALRESQNMMILETRE